MKIAICYKGMFNINYVRQKGVDEELLKVVNETINNHKEMIYSDLSNETNQIDTFLSSYDIDKKLNELLITGYEAKDFCLLSKNDINTNTWMAQLFHLNNLIKMVREEETRTKIKYDFFIFTRFDIHFHKKFSNFKLEMDKFNITVEHPSGNCDDNLWILPRNYLNIFEESVNILIKEGKMTHELNHKIISLGGHVSYIDKLVDSYMGHTIFSFIR